MKAKIILTALMAASYGVSLQAEPREGVVQSFYVPITSDFTVTGNLIVLGTINGLPVEAFTGLGNATSANLPNTIVMRDATASFGVTNITASGTINTQGLNATNLTVTNDVNVNGTVSATTISGTTVTGTTVTGNTVSASGALIFPAGTSNSVVGLQLNGHPNTGFWENGNALTLVVNGTTKLDTDGGTVHLYGAPLRMYGQGGQQILLQADSTINLVANAVAALDVSSTQITAHVPISGTSVSATTVTGSTVNATTQLVAPAGSSASNQGLKLLGINNSGFFLGGGAINFAVNGNTKFNSDGGTLNVYGNPINLWGNIGNTVSFPGFAITGVTTQIIDPGVATTYNIPAGTSLYLVIPAVNSPGITLVPTSPISGQMLTIARAGLPGAAASYVGKDIAYTFDGQPYRLMNIPSGHQDSYFSFTYYYDGSNWNCISSGN